MQIGGPLSSAAARLPGCSHLIGLWILSELQQVLPDRPGIFGKYLQGGNHDRADVVVK